MIPVLPEGSGDKVELKMAECMCVCVFVQLSSLLPHPVSLTSNPELLDPDLKNAVICAMKISQQPQGLGSW